MNWDKVRALADWSLVIVTLGLVVGGILAYRSAERAVHTAERAIHSNATYDYLRMWNSPHMLQQRQILAQALLPVFQKAVADRDPRVRLTGLPPNYRCEYKNTLEPKDLEPLYGAPNFYLSYPSCVGSGLNPEQRSAFESVRTFFEQLGAAYKEEDLNDYEAFEAFSLPAEAYWTAAVSGWLKTWLAEGDNDPTVGTEFRYFECKAEQQEVTKAIKAEELELVLAQDAHLLTAHDPPVAANSVEFGPRIPTDYFVTTGTGESDQGIPPDPYETFSYDIALLQAGIEDFNVVPYTSVLPPEAREVSLEDEKPTFHHGAVLETIMAKEGGTKNQTVCAGIGRVWAVDAAGTAVGGYAAEYQYTHDTRVSVGVGEQEAKAQLTQSLNHELMIRGFRQTGEMKFDVACLSIQKKYGLALAALGFVRFSYPKAPPSRACGR